MEKKSILGKEPITVESVVILRVETEKKPADRPKGDESIFTDEKQLDNRNCLLNALVSFTKDSPDNLTKMQERVDFQEYADLITRLNVK
jgi:hypothetical protein